jgi:CRISPR-associated protein Cas2
MIFLTFWVARVVVVLANDLPPAVRGRMKLWFVEPRANVFVSGIKDSVATTVIEYLYQHCPPESGVTIFRSNRQPPGYEIKSIGPTKKEIIEITGLQLVVETLKSI